MSIGVSTASLSDLADHLDRIAARASIAEESADAAVLREVGVLLREMQRQREASEPARERHPPAAGGSRRLLEERAARAEAEAEEQRHASEAKSAFVAAMSHEFRTPLTAILAFAEMLVAGIPEPISGVPLRHAERIVVAAKHLGELIDQVLSLARIESGREQLQIEPVDLAGLLQETAALVEPLSRQKGLPLRIEIPEPVPPFETDANKLRQVLFNLMGNAVKFTERGEVRVTLRSVGQGVTIEVRDTGPGIAPEHLDRIWEPFWRGGEANGARPAGTGLGLGIVQRLVHLLGGEVSASSERDRGTVFVVKLPPGLPGK